MAKSLLCALLLAAALQAQNIFSVAGLPVTHRNDVDSQPALSAPLGPVYGLLIDKVTGRLLFNDQSLVLRAEPDGTVLAIAGAASTLRLQPQLAATAPAVNLSSVVNFQTLRGMAQDSSGALYLSDAIGRVYRIALDGTVTTFAGGGTAPPGSQSDGGPATSAVLTSPRGLVFDSKGNLDIAEVYCNCIRQVTPKGIITTLYQLPPSSGPGRLPGIEGLAIDSQDNLYFTEWNDSRVVEVRADGNVTVLAGNGISGFFGDGGVAADAELNGPSGVALDGSGNLYIADTRNHRIREIAQDGTISTIAGTGTCGYSGDGGPAAMAQLCNPAEIMFDAAGNMLIADYGNRRVRGVTPDGTISTIAGSGVFDPANFVQQAKGDGGPEIHATFGLVGGAAFDATGNLYISDAQAGVIRRVGTDGTVSSIPGVGQFAGAGPILASPDGAIYVIASNSRVWKIMPDGSIVLVAGVGTGTGLNRSQGDGGPAIEATLNEPGGLAFDPQGNLYIADTSNARVRKVDSNGIITTVAGPAPQQGVDYYNAVAVDPRGNLYVAWTHAAPPSISATVNRVNADGSLTPVAGSGQPCAGGPGQFTSDGVPALQARLCAVVALAVDKSGTLYLSEGGYSVLLKLASDGTIQRVAGNTATANPGDGGAATSASLAGGQGWSPGMVTFDPSGNLYIPEPGLNLIRKVSSVPYQLAAAPASLDLGGAQSVAVAISSNFPEPFPYAVQVTTSDGGRWLNANRAAGQTGDSITVSTNPSGLKSGSYHGTVSVIVSVPAGAPLGGAGKEVDIPVALAVP